MLCDNDYVYIGIWNNYYNLDILSFFVDGSGFSLGFGSFVGPYIHGSSLSSPFFCGIGFWMNLSFQCNLELSELNQSTVESCLMICRNGSCDAVISTESNGFNSIRFLPSKDAHAGPRAELEIWILNLVFPGKWIGRVVSVCEQIGVTRIECFSGWTSDPPADSE